MFPIELHESCWVRPPTLSHPVLSVRNFPRPLAHSISNYIHLSSFWTLLSKILRQDREISSFLSKNFRDFRLAFWPRFARRLCYKVLLFELWRQAPSLQAIYLHFESFSAKSVDRIARNHHFCKNNFRKILLAFLPRLGARGQPSTWSPRGRHVETEKHVPMHDKHSVARFPFLSNNCDRP